MRSTGFNGQDLDHVSLSSACQGLLLISTCLTKPMIDRTQDLFEKMIPRLFYM